MTAPHQTSPNGSSFQEISATLNKAFNLNTTRPDETWRLAQEALETALANKRIAEAADAHNLLAIASWSIGNSDTALQHAQESAHLFDSLPQNYFGQSCARNTLGAIHLETGEFDQAILVLIEALRLAEKDQHPLSLGYINSNIAQGLIEQGEPDIAQDYIDRAKYWGDQIETPILRAEIILLEGRKLYLTQKFDLAAKQYQRALSLISGGVPNRISAVIKHQLSDVYFAQKKWEEGVASLEQASHTFSQVGHIPGIIDTELAKGRYYRKTDNQALVKHHLRYALQLAEATDSHINQIRAHSQLSSWYESQQEWRSSLIHAKAQMALQEKHFTLAKQQQAAELRIKHEADIKEKELEIYRAQAEEITNKHDQLETLMRERSNMLSIFAHDLRTPLATATLTLQLLDMQWDNYTEKKRLRKFEDLSHSIHNLTEIATSLSEFADIDVEQQTPRRETVQLRPFIHRTVFQFEGHARKKSIELLIQNCEPHVMLETDPALLNRIISNLISNAIKYSLPQTSITIEINVSHTDATFSITDQGLGLTSDDMAQLFQKFTRLSARPTGGESSTGLGLYIVKQCAKLLLGDVQAQSNGRGEGSTFTFTHPIRGVS